ncbi:hypothetical protein EYF80_045261 [Liparis tanakae]|uniref:Uncharacterized protein n=1 Tax=Liparis tanakae TaxID=230148 RepID=A0A4Z2FTL1_9TELE|nr:hypothetical protein EYF80_045261 [Liparis tanakae]
MVTSTPPSSGPETGSTCRQIDSSGVLKLTDSILELHTDRQTSRFCPRSTTVEVRPKGTKAELCRAKTNGQEVGLEDSC